MKTTIIATLLTVGIAALPAVASADAIAASLSASFGTEVGLVNVDAGDLSGDITRPTSVAVAGAAGDFAVATSVANAASAGAASGATSGTEFAPTAAVAAGADNLYSTTVSFVPTVDIQAIADMAAADAIAELCATDFTVVSDLTATTSGTVNVGDLAPLINIIRTVNSTGDVTGTITVSCAE